MQKITGSIHGVLLLKETATVWLAQTKVLEDRVAGVMHVLMFWGFLMLSTDMFDLVGGNRFSEHILPDLLNPIWNGMVELGYTSALIGCFLALNRRVLFTPEKLKGKSQLEGNVIPFDHDNMYDRIRD